MEAYSICEVWDEFSVAKREMDRLIGVLRSDDMAHAQHGDVERLIKIEGFEILRRLFQGHLDHRAEHEDVAEGVGGSEGVFRTHVKHGCTRPLESLFGEVIVTRIGYGLPGYSSLFPLDRELNLPQAKYSHGLQEVLGEEASKSAFDDAVSMVDKQTGGHVPKRQAQETIPRLSIDFDAFYANKLFDPSKESEDLLVLSVDGKGVVMREDSLREATRQSAIKAREESKNHKQPRLKPGEKPNRKRMATVTAVYSVAPYIRQPQDVLCDMRKEEQEESREKPPSQRPRPSNKKVSARLVNDIKHEIFRMFDWAQLQDPLHQRRWVVVVDGDEKQLRYIKQAAKKFDVDVTIVVDIVHVSEYLWKASHCFHKVGSDESRDWVADKMLEILRGNAGQVAGGIKRSATKLNMSEKKRENVDKCAKYLASKKQYMHYDQYLAQGFPIGSGVIEGACRYLVKDRMDITGARWGLESAEAVLKLRALKTNGDMDEYWKFHKQEDFKRLHHSKFSTHPILEVVK